MPDSTLITPEHARRSTRPRTPVAARLAGQSQLLAAFSHAHEQTRVLRHGETFAVFDRYGDINPGGFGEKGLYHQGTRFLSCLLLELDGGRPLLLSSMVGEENDELAVILTNPDLRRDGQMWLPLGTLHFKLTKLVWRGVCYQQLWVKNLGAQPVASVLSMHFEADFADILDVRSTKRRLRGQHLPPETTGDRVVLAYSGIDGVVRRTVVQFEPPPAVLTGSTAILNLLLEPQEEAIFCATVACEYSISALVLRIDEARTEAQADRERYSAGSCDVVTSNDQMNAWIRRALGDLRLMTSELSTGPYPYAGLPWFNTPFGRDAIVTALECLWLRPELARGVLTYLASTQATEVIRERDAEPGKILHEARAGEVAALNASSLGRYYGSVDATPLFVLLAGEYYKRTGDRTLVESLWPNIEAALHWIDCYGDRDQDGFVEYHRQSADGLRHQGWKDSDDAVFHADGAPAAGPIALCEVQGYVYAARRAAAMLAGVLRHAARATQLTRQADELQARFDEAFWCDELATYALALDGNKRACRVRTSNAGHCLFTGIASREHALRVARTLLGGASFSGWGVRTLAADEIHYNPTGYHTGCVWPHDNALIARGLARYGLVGESLQILTALFEAAIHFEMQRMPELFCGFPRQRGEGPVLHPVACAPQAWSAASVLLLLQSCVGLEINGAGSEVHFTRPQLPLALAELQIRDLEVAGATVDIQILRQGQNVGVIGLGHGGEVRVVVD